MSVVVGARLRAPLDANALAPIVAFENAVEPKPYALHVGNRAESFLQRLVKRGQLIDGVARATRINVYDIPVHRLESEILVLKIVQTSREHARADEENERERSLYHDERFLWQRRTI